METPDQIFNQIFVRAQLDALKAALTSDQKEIYNQVLLFERDKILERLSKIPLPKREEILLLFQEALA